MNIRIWLLLMRETEQRNDERIKAYEHQRKRASHPRRHKPKGNRDKPIKPSEKPLQ